jgi:predicted DNA-binding transcriptional regulator YafY
MYQENQNLIKVVAIFDKKILRGRPLYGSTAQEDLGDRIRSEFLVDHLDYMAHWLLLFGPNVEIAEPEELKIQMQELTESLFSHYKLKEGVAHQ